VIRAIVARVPLKSPVTGVGFRGEEMFGLSVFRQEPHMKRRIHGRSRKDQIVQPQILS
jgi:hypothetical protein